MPNPIRSGIITVTASATDNVGVVKVELYIDNVIRGTSTIPPYTFAYNTTQLVDGDHTMFCRAYDAVGNVGQSSNVVITVTNTDTVAPVTSITSPTTGSTVNGTITVNATATDNVGVAKVELYVDNILKATDTTTPYNFTVDTSTYNNGVHNFQTKAYDAANNVGTSAIATYTFNNTSIVTAISRGINRAGAEYGDDFNGWNGQTYFYWETNNEISAEITYLKGKGFDHYRLPISWERLQSTLNGSFNTTYQNNLTRVVTAMISGGMKVIIDLHNYARYATGAFNTGGTQVSTYTQRIMGDGNLNFSNLNDVWSKLATLFPNSETNVIFNLMNEPHDFSYNSTNWFSGVNGVIAAIRATGAKNLILVPNTRGSDIGHWNNTTVGGPVDAVAALNVTDSMNNIAFDMHCYNGYEWNGDNFTTNTDIVINWARTNGKKLWFSEIGIDLNLSGGNTILGAFLTKLNNNSDVVLGWTPWNLVGGSGSDYRLYNYSNGSTTFTDTAAMAWYQPYLSSGGGVNPGTSYPTNPATGYSTNTRQSFTTNSVTSYYFVPNTYNSSHSTPIKLFIWLHGCYGYSLYDINYFSPNFSGFNNKNNLPINITQNWITLAPGGAEGGCWNGSADWSKLTDAINYMKSRFNINPKNIFIGGYSSGGDIGYPYAYANSSIIAGALFCNTDPFNPQGTPGNGYDTVTNKFNVAHLAHLSDNTYPIAQTRADLTTLTTAGYSVTKIEQAGNHGDYPINPSTGQSDGDPSLNGPSTNRDIYQYLLPYLNAGWTAP